MINLPMQQLAPGKMTKLVGDADSDKGVPYPAAIAVIGAVGAEKLLVAGNLSDDVLLLDAATGAIEKRFDLSESDAVPSAYPIALAVTRDGARAFVALWNSSEIAELDLVNQTVGRKLTLLKPSSPISSRNPSLCLRVFSGRQNSLCRALQPRCRCGDQHRLGPALREGILRYPASASELLWRRACGARRQRRW